MRENEIDISREPDFIQFWCGALLARAGEYAAAIGQLEHVVDPAAELLSQIGPEPHLDGPHALAWSDLRTGATAKGRRRCCPLLRGESDVALDWLERARGRGFRREARCGDGRA